jgi:carboxyl-terminal processing protease
LTSPRRRAGFGSGLLAGILLGLAVAALVAALTGSFSSDDDLPNQARDVIRSNYFKPVDDSTLNDASVNGMVDELRHRYDDRFSHYFPPKDLEDFNAATSGQFSGVGLTVSEVKRGLRIASVLPDTPAERSGLQEGDVITAVDGKSIAGTPSQVSTGEIKGPPGTKVTLTIDPTGPAGERDVKLERADVRVPAVQGEIRRDPAGQKVGYVQFSTFSEGAHAELRSTVERLYREGAQGLVIDLRGNGGGLLDEAVLCGSIFVEDGKIVSTRSRTQGDQTYDAVGNALDSKPIVVLINQDTASAAEILTAALEDHGLATVVGTRSYGKGVFQEVIHLDSGGALDLTVGQYFTPDGENLAGVGIKPQVRAADDPKTRPDEGRDAALAELGKLLSANQ